MISDASAEMPWEINEAAFPRQGRPEEQLRFVLRYAILAPSTRNTQPWKFRIDGSRLDIHVDKDRWLRVADADQRELYLSIGCALENLLTALRHFGVGHTVDYLPDPAQPDRAVCVQLTGQPVTTPAMAEDLLDAIINRQSNHYGFKPTEVNQAMQQRLREAVQEPGISLFLTEHAALKDEIDQLSVQADAMQFADPEFMEEFGQDLAAGTFGAPWLVAKLHRMAIAYLNPDNPIVQVDSQRLTNAPLLCLITSTEDILEARIRAGQAFERIWLSAAHMGLSLQPMTQALQLPALRQELARITGIGNQHPQQFFRLGYAERNEGIYTHRRPLESMLLGPEAIHQ